MDVFYFEPRDPSSNGEKKGRKKEGGRRRDGSKKSGERRGKS